MHPWLAIINGVQQEIETIEMVKKGEEEKVEENNETNAEAGNKEDKKVGEDKDNEEDTDNEQNEEEEKITSDNNCSHKPITLSRQCSTVNTVPWPLM